MRLYVDGVQQQLTSIALDLALNTGDQDDNPVLVGARYKMVDDLLAAHFVGQIDDIRVYNRALSPGVIEAQASKKAVWYVDDSAPVGARACRGRVRSTALAVGSATSSLVQATRFVWGRGVTLPIHVASTMR